MALSIKQFESGERIPGTVYRVEELVGSGGMGSVYRVEHTELGRRFVLKALHGHLSSRDDLVARLRNEWRALAKLDHENIVQVTDAGRTSDGLPFYVMESLKGATLGRLLADAGSIPVKRACSIICDILAGLHAAHQTGAIHRDIKPPNIFVEDGGTTKLLDFGIAKLRDQAARVVTAGGVSIGTPRYMAPEQAEGTKVDARADIYATALVLYEMVVGKGPFADIRDPNELVMAHISKEPERADFIRSSVPPELADLIQRWLSKSPNSRPANAELARRELMALAEVLPAENIEDTEEVTLGGAYDASTVGADVIESHRPIERKSDEPAEAEHTEFGEPDNTETFAHEGEPSERVSRPTGPQGTLGWGTDEDEVSPETRVPDGKSSGAATPGRKKRRSLTPPPVSSVPSRRPSRIPAGAGRSIRWIAATAAVSFLVAWGVSQLVTEAPPEEAAESLPPPASVPASSAPPPEFPEVEPEDAQAPTPNAEQLESSPEATRGPKGTQAPSGAPPQAPDSYVGKPPQKAAPRTAPIPASSPRKPPAKKPEKPADPGLPGSGLW